MPTQRARNWCITYNFTKDKEESEFLYQVFTGHVNLCYLSEDAPLQYFICQLECAESGTFHAQGYLQWKAQRSMVYAKKAFAAPTIHLEQQNATDNEDAKKYCQKSPTAVPDTFFEVGEFRGERERGEAIAKGKRKAFEDVLDYAKSRKSLRGIYLFSFAC